MIENVFMKYAPNFLLCLSTSIQCKKSYVCRYYSLITFENSLLPSYI